ncbi:MAG: hypothetical protein JWR74_1895 [Polaromonas sp.]|nr:hypothetical protein [Polaromonas sp.]
MFLKKTKIIHFFAGAACAASVSPLGIIAAALVPVVVGFAKEVYVHFSSKRANPDNLAWVIAGAATFVLCFKLLPMRL